jgi:hypothetical protein
MKMTIKRACMLLAGCACAAHVAAQTHVHGLARLDIAVDAARISLQLASPLDNLLGFERAPRTDAERRQSEALVARLRAADTMFRIDPAAGCTLARVELTSAALKLGQATPGEEGHADLDAEVIFNCTDATKATTIEVALFDAAPRLQRLDVQVATPQGQFKRDLVRPARRIKLTR